MQPRIGLDFRRKGRIANCVGRLTCSPAGALRARLAICGALGRASVKSGAANQRSPSADPFHRKVSESRERRTQKGERQILCAKAAQGHIRYGHRQETAAVCFIEVRASRRQNAGEG